MLKTNSISDTTPNSVSTWTWLCVAYRLTFESSSHKKITNITFIRVLFVRKMLGTRYGFVGTRFRILGIRIGSLKRLKIPAFIFETSPNTKPKDKKVGGHGILCLPRLKKWGDTSPLSPTKLRPWPTVLTSKNSL